MSGYSHTNYAPTVTCYDGTEELNIWDADYVGMRDSVTAQDDVIVTTEWAANLPGLAASRLNSPYLAWAIAMYNGILDPIHDVYPGVRLRIPDKDSLTKYLASRAASQTSAGHLTNETTVVL